VQLDAVACEHILDLCKKTPLFAKNEAFENLVGKGIEPIPAPVTDRYLQAVLALAKDSKAKHTKVVYTPLNGAGYQMVPKVLETLGADFVVVKEQGYPDGNFATCPYPNPEKKEALVLGMEYAKKHGADILVATDPDCDRVGVAVLHKGSYTQITGNEFGVLLVDYLLSIKSIKNPIVVRSIVSTSLVDEMIRKVGGTVICVPTGFRYIGDLVQKMSDADKARFVLGFEESCGYLAGLSVRDKDAVEASMLAVLMVEHYKQQGQTLLDVLDGLYQEYGRFVHITKSYEFAGSKGRDTMQNLLASLRSETPDFGDAVVRCKDYLQSTPSLNMIEYDLANGNKVIVRPSGTEPQIKAYITLVGQGEQQKVLEKVDKAMKK
ncbi:MAG: phospho-sugar mutase, partial [Firmicutes bacterium]|nr:phospho-sugar mutase [Bacillota bacterium]